MQKTSIMNTLVITGLHIVNDKMVSESSTRGLMAPTSGSQILSKSPIDRESPIPYYVQLKSVLGAQIDSGVWQPGDQLPSEPELCRQYGVSRTVVRQALKEMSYEGIIIRRKGKGTFAAEPKISSTSLVHSLSGFAQDMAERGLMTINKVLEQSIVPANQKVASFLEVDELTPLIKIDRLRFVEGEPIVLVTSFLPYELCRELVQANLEEMSLYDYLEEKFNLKITRGRRLIDAVVANEYEANLLQIEMGAPLIRVESVSYIQDGTAIEYFIALFRADRSRFDVEIAHFSGQPGLQHAMGLNLEEVFLG